MLNGVKHLARGQEVGTERDDNNLPASQILRFAQDDKWVQMFTRIWE